MLNRANLNSFNLLFGLLLFLMITFSTTLMSFKLLLFVLLLLLMTLKGFINPSMFNVDKRVFAWVLLYVVSNIFFILLSVFYGNPGAFNGFNTGIIEPLFYFLIILYVKKNHFLLIWKWLKLFFLITCLYNIVFAAAINGILSIDPTYFLSVVENYGGFTFGYIKISPANIPWLIFLLPCYMSKFFFSEEKIEILDYVLVLFGSINAILTLRTAFVLGIAITPFLCLLLAYLCGIPINKRNVKVALTAITLIFVILFISVSDFLNTLSEGILTKIIISFTLETNTVDSGGYIRLMQAQDLLYTWAQRPIFGWGASANALHVVRSDVEGTYELTYLALLMQKGIVGFSLFWLQIFWIFKEGIHLVKKHLPFYNYMLPVLVGWSVILLANGTNPYIGSFDRLFILFIPLLILNLSYREQ